MNPVASTVISFSALGRRIRPPVIARLMNAQLEDPTLLSLGAGFTDNQILPAQAVARIVQRIADEDTSNATLQYGPNQGRPGLRELACRHFADWPGELPRHYQPERAFVTNGSQQALYLAMQVLCDPGDIVLVENPSYFVFLELARGLGIECIGLPCDRAGALDFPRVRESLDALRTTNRLHRVRAVYFNGNYANPSARSMPEAEKRQLGRVLQEAEVIVPAIEDTAYRELFYEEPHPSPTILSMEEWEPFPRLLAATFTKPFATGLKIGCSVCTEDAWLQKMLQVKGHHDFGSAHFNQAILEEALRGGEYAHHLGPMRQHYSAKMGVLHDALDDSPLRRLGWSWERPAGGILLWARGPDDSDTAIDSPFCNACLENRVLYVPGDLSFAAGRPRNCVRLSIGGIATEQIPEAVERFAQAAAATTP